MLRSLNSDARRRWKLFAVTAIIVLALASSGYAYWRINAPQSLTLYATATLPPLELRMELDKTEFQLNETIRLRLYLKNIDVNQVNVTFAYKNFVFGFVVKDENGETVFVHPTLLLCALKEVIIKPNEQIDETLEWAQEYNKAFYGQPFKPGIYKIIGRTGNYYLVPSPPTSQIETPPLVIEVKS